MAEKAEQTPVRVSEYHPDYHGPKPVWRDCPGEDEPLLIIGPVGSSEAYRCRSCSTTFFSPPHRGMPEVIRLTLDVSDPYPPPHQVLVTIHEQMRDRIAAIGESLGFDPGSDAVLRAGEAARSHPKGSTDAQVARAVASLSLDVTRRSVMPEARKALDDLLAFRGDFPDDFFTETTLYDMLGKEDARTLLSLVRAVSDALGDGG